MKKILLLFIVLAALPSCRSDRPTDEEIAALKQELQSESDKDLVRFYEARQFAPAWIADGEPQQRVQDAAALVAAAPGHGLEAGAYPVHASPATIEEEIELTRTLIRFASDVSARGEPVVDALLQAIDHAALASLADRLAPLHPAYARLRNTLGRTATDGALSAEEFNLVALNMDRLRQLPRDPGPRYFWVNIPEFKLTAVENGAETLSMNVVVGKEETPTPVFSEAMTHVVFSPYWNIPESILTNETLPKVRQDPNYLAQQNIEIIRVSGDQHEVVDPAELDPAELTASSQYRFRQRPGYANALGLVKFMFPNKYNVYLHDTPADSLFSRPERDFSHGCVRVEHPLELAKYVLRDQPDWTDERIRKAMHSGKESAVYLSEPIPVHIVYLTVAADDSGKLQHFRDIYGLDSE